MTISNDPRLRALAQLIPPSQLLIDVGCDHGKLATWVLQQGLAQRVIASDISSRSLAKLTTQDPRLQKRCGDGLTVLQPDERPDTIVIAGVGGLTIMHILDQLCWDAVLVLSPHTHVADVCRYLDARGFCIAHHSTVSARRKNYTIIQAVPKCPTQSTTC